MKKVSFLVAAFAVSALSVSAQKAYEGTRFLDNWYVGVKGGVTTPTAHSAFWPNMRAETGIELGKQITPVLGVSFEGLTGINTSSGQNRQTAASPQEEEACLARIAHRVYWSSR